MASQHILAGGLSGLVEITYTCNHFDYMKVSLQQNKKIVFKEFYRGILSRYTSVFPHVQLWGCRNTGVRILKNRNIIEKGSAIR